MTNGNPFSKKELEVVSNTTLTHTQAAKKIGRSVNSVYSKRHQLGLIDKCKGHRRKWIGSELNEIADTKKTISELATQFNKSKSRVCQIRQELKVA
ncbi:hypothetical protein [uncultured Psychrosphaera sp.]|uniref:hypothetical protein n=1 Tax=uncultured Psychrosphaera sp. TaxID=1403522 RepID=UPI0026074F17|nr:hypothetical protein [uncultured Psychrosphaera sp.]